MIKLIGLCGYAQSGKSTIAEYLVNTYGYRRIRFADGLKNMLRVIGLTKEQIDGNEKEIPLDLLCGRTPRYAMQMLGTEYGRNLIGQDIWVNIWAKEVRESTCSVVVDDVRFPNEFNKVKELNGYTVKIIRPGYGPLNNHPSETSLENVHYDMTVHNDGTKEGLYQYTETLLKYV